MNGNCLNGCSLNIDGYFDGIIENNSFYNNKA